MPTVASSSGLKYSSVKLTRGTCPTWPDIAIELSLPSYGPVIEKLSLQLSWELDVLSSWHERIEEFSWELPETVPMANSTGLV